MELFELTAVQAIEKIKKKKISVLELVESCIRRIEAKESLIKAWAYFNKGLVYMQAEEI